VTKFLFWDGASQQRSIAKGYSDGFLTAKMFAMQGTSKLGFVGQYVIDSVRALGPDIVAPGTEGDYEDGFVKGLEDGEMVVASAMNGV
jgi:glucan 1,3-beta-glucosidase